MAYCCARRKALGGLLLAGITVGTGVVGWKRFAAAPVELPEAEVCLDAPPSAYDPASGLALSAARPIPVDARCPVCGLFPARSKEWAAQVIFNNGDAHFFDSPVSFFLFVQNMERFMSGGSARGCGRLRYGQCPTNPASVDCCRIGLLCARLERLGAHALGQFAGVF